MNQQNPVKFLLELMAELAHLRKLFGNDWLRLLSKIEPLIYSAVMETDPLRLAARVNQVFRVFRDSPAQPRVDEIYRRTMVVDSDDRSRRGLTPPTEIAQQVSARDTHELLVAADLLRRRLLDAMVEMPQPSPELVPPDTQAGAQGAVFHFLFEGDGVNGNTLRDGSLAKLIFDYGTAPQHAIPVKNEGLDDARTRNVGLVLVATARGPVQFQGPQLQRATFENGKLCAPVNFELLAVGHGTATLIVEFLVRGESIHMSEILIEVVARNAAAEPAPASGLTVKGTPGEDFAQYINSTRARPAQEITLSLAFASNSLRIGLTDCRYGETEFTEEYQSVGLDPSSVETILKSVHNDMRSAYDDVDFWRQFDGNGAAQQEEASPELVRCLEVLAAAGSRLNAGLRKDKHIAQALDYVEANASQGAVVSVSTEDIFLPWELLFPDHRTLKTAQDDPEAGPVCWERFWGARFAIETNMRGIGSMSELRKRHLKGPLKVTVNLNPKIMIKGLPEIGQPLEVQRAWAKKLDARGMLDGVQNSCKEARPVLLRGTKNVSMIYVYCHGAAPNALGGIAELVRLDEGCDVEPRDFQKKPAYRSAPIVFLNACMAAVSSPLMYSSFLKELRTREALGLIAPTYSVPIVFGAHFGLEVIESYVGRRGSLATAFLELRRRHLQRFGNPVPLLYTLQCHLEVPAELYKEGSHE